MCFVVMAARAEHGLCPGLTYTRVLQNNRMQKGKRRANNSIHYYFIGPEERMKEVKDPNNPHGPSVRPAVFKEMLDSLLITNPVVSVFF